MGGEHSSPFAPLRPPTTVPHTINILSRQADVSMVLKVDLVLTRLTRHTSSEDSVSNVNPTIDDY